MWLIPVLLEAFPMSFPQPSQATDEEVFLVGGKSAKRPAKLPIASPLFYAPSPIRLQFSMNTHDSLSSSGKACGVS